MSLIENNKNQPNVGVGNYKGVMLCNRPFAGSVGQATKVGTTDKNSFSCGVVSDPAGTNVSIASLERKYPKRKKKETALTKHRKWLAELQKTKDRLESQYQEEVQKANESKQKFSEKEAQMRQIARNSTAESKDNAAESKSDSKTDSKADSKVQKPKTKLPRPAWALSEGEAETVSEQKELEDEDDLIAFAKGLDFDRYIDDLEVQTMMEKVKQRIAQLEHETLVEGQREDEISERAALRLAMEEKYGKNPGDDDESADEKDEESESYLAAKEILSEAGDLKGVHSTKSVASMYRQAKESKDDDGHGVINQPIIIKHEPGEGSRLENKKNPSNLPYIHRNPAV
eukprot:CAMPEP_0174817910 /NCGR_PEP_ID=MMETSP1107-20130205/468_1 /TAXON_ID=36770 /ORGANISM="Paraphysomonas vestita, Strain GFlagA" /LENGTH=342 /DNA_ID=CAMNT_0016029043 /DNA_START=916 /DNA_END=1944 /DNA_ORIENTATION=-